MDILSNQGNFGLSVKVGDMIAPAGVYAGDRVVVDSVRMAERAEPFSSRHWRCA
jgi:hypothetical protein